MKKITVKEKEMFMVYCGKDRYYVQVEEQRIEENGMDHNYKEGIARGDLTE